MTREETRSLVAFIAAAYINTRMTDASATVNAWYAILEPYRYQDILEAVKIHSRTDTKGFPPAPGQLIGMIGSREKLSGLSEMEAWGMVAKAIRNGAYHSKEEFAKLPPEIQRAVGCPEQIEAWATDEDYSEGVAQSNFLRTYRAEKERGKTIEALPVADREEVSSRLERYTQAREPLAIAEKDTLPPSESVNTADTCADTDNERNRIFAERIDTIREQIHKDASMRRLAERQRREDAEAAEQRRKQEILEQLKGVVA